MKTKEPQFYKMFKVQMTLYPLCATPRLITEISDSRRWAVLADGRVVAVAPIHEKGNIYK